MILRSGRDCQSCSLKSHRRRHHLKTTWYSLPSEIQYKIVKGVLCDDTISLRQILRYMNTHKQWRGHVRRFIYYNEPNPKKLLQVAVESDAVGIVRLLIDRPDIHFEEYNLKKLL